MADLKITQLTADTNPALADLFVTAKSPFGAGSNRKVTISDLLTARSVVISTGASTDNAIMRWNTASGLSAQNSAVQLDDNGYLIFTGNRAVGTANYEIGVDTSSGLEYNVPTGKGHDFYVNGTIIFFIGPNRVQTSAPTVDNTTVPASIGFTTGSITNHTASTESPGFYVHPSSVQFKTGALTLQRTHIFESTSYSFVGASTLTHGATFFIDSGPSAGTNATVTNSTSLWICGVTSRANCTGTASDMRISPIGIANSVGAMTTIARIWADNISLNGNTILGNQTATLTNLNVIRIDVTTYTSTTNVRTVTNPVSVYLTAPVASTNVTFTNPALALQCVDAARFDGNIGFFATAPTTQQTSGENLTNNVTAGGVDGTIANFTDLVVYANDAAAIRNDIYQLSRKLKQVNDALRAYGLLT